MSKINGTLFRVYVDGNKVGSTTSCSISLEVDLPETTTKDSEGWAEHLIGGGLRSATGSFEGFEDPSDQYNVDELFDLLDQRVDFDVQIKTENAGDSIWIGKATISNLELEYEMEQPVTISGEFQFNGRPQRVPLT